MTRTKAPDARIVPHVRGKPVTWLTPLPPNRGPTDAGERQIVSLKLEELRFPLKRGTNPVVWQSIVGRGREPTEQTNNPIRAVFRYTRHYYGGIGYSTDHRIRGPNLFANVLTNLHRREGPTARLYFSRARCRGETRARDIETKVFICGTQCPGREGDAAG